MVFPWKAFFAPGKLYWKDQILTFLAFFRAFGFSLAVQFFRGLLTLHLVAPTHPEKHFLEFLYGDYMLPAKGTQNHHF